MNKIKLLFVFGCFSFAHAQSVNEYYGHLGPVSGIENVNHRVYNVLSSTAPLDHSPSGVNASWNFSQLSSSGTTAYDNVAPSAGETTNYPGTTMVTINVNSAGITPTVSKLYTKINQAMTGATSEATGININYSDNLTMGTFPLNFNYSNTDAVSGTYTYTTYSGTFTGSATTSVDAYGTLTTNDYGSGPNAIDVIRLKIVQTLNLNYGPFTNAGTVNITAYHYYRPNENFPFFTSVSSTINVPLLSINQTNTALEGAGPGLLGNPNFESASVSLAPNPVNDVLSITAPDQAVRSISIIDNNGRTVLTDISPIQTVDVSKLAGGVYFARIETDRGILTKKIIKQ